MVFKSKVSALKKVGASNGKKFKVSKNGSKTTSTKVADVNSLDMSDILESAAKAGKSNGQEKKKKLASLDAKSLKVDQQKDEAKKELEKKQSAEAGSLLDQLELM